MTGNFQVEQIYKTLCTMHEKRDLCTHLLWVKKFKFSQAGRLELATGWWDTDRNII